MRLGRRLTIAAIRGYQLVLSPVLGGQCRFAPTCSEYARLAVQELGACRGLALALWRVLKCHPLHPGGVDPPPVAGPRRP